ncbi:MAG: DUF5317 domain-containing protein [Desulfitobacteriaceae bacterium]
MIYEVLLLVVLVALIRKGSFQRLSNTDIKKPYLMITSLLVQLAVMYLYDRSQFIGQTFSIWIILSYLLLAYGSWCNRNLPGFKLFGIGMFLNFLVIAANGGRMPVSINALEWAGLSWYIPALIEGITKHQPLTDAAYLSFLADIIPLRPPFVFSSMVVSAGDIAVTLGISRFFYIRMTR